MARALLAVWPLLAVACGGAQPAPATPTCPAGTTWNGTDCAAILDTSCQPGMRFVSGRGCVAIVAEPPPAPPAPPPSAPPPSDASGVPQTVWVAHMIANLPPRVCAAPYFQQCFVATAAECEVAMRALTRSCIHDRRATLPRFFDRDSGRIEGTKIGQCVGSAYELDMRGKGRFVSNAACNDPTRWK
jgi:hypothetical protein